MHESYYVVICAPSGSNIFFHIISKKDSILEKKVFFSLQIFLKHFPFYE